MIQPYEYTDTQAKDLRPTDRVEYGIDWRCDDDGGYRTGIGEVVEVQTGQAGSLVKVLVEPHDARYMGLVDGTCLMVLQKLRKVQ